MTPCATLSFGPPLSHATTGFPAAIASRGTIPKCSFAGVYSTHVHASSSARFSSLAMETRNSTSPATPSARASASRKARTSTHSRRRSSYPPARISFGRVARVSNGDASPEVAARLSSRNLANARSASSRFFLRSNRFTDRNTTGASAVAGWRSREDVAVAMATAGYTTAGCVPFRYSDANVFAKTSAVNLELTTTPCARPVENSSRKFTGARYSRRSGDEAFVARSRSGKWQ